MNQFGGRPVIPALRSLRQEDHNFEAIVRFISKKEKKTN
jgi:hypothetical protein